MTESYRVRIIEIHDEDAYEGTLLGESLLGRVGIFTPIHEPKHNNDAYLNTTWRQAGYVAGDFVPDKRDGIEELYCFYAVKLERLEEEEETL